MSEAMKRGTKDYTYWLADKIPAFGDYGKEAADVLRQQADELDALRAQLEEARAANHVLSDELLDIGELVGGDGGVYTRVRIAVDSLAAKDAELNEVRQSLQAAIQRAERAEEQRRHDDEADTACRNLLCEERDEAERQRDALQARVGKLEAWVSEALELQRKHYGNGMMTHMGLADWSRSVCFDMAKNSAALASREGGE